MICRVSVVPRVLFRVEATEDLVVSKNDGRPVLVDGTASSARCFFGAGVASSLERFLQFLLCRAWWDSETRVPQLMQGLSVVRCGNSLQYFLVTSCILRSHVLLQSPQVVLSILHCVKHSLEYIKQ